ncbi:hypothetical protein PFISCL1PPCAC_22971, partial [Pristionchus fissidentatus]
PPEDATYPPSPPTFRPLHRSDFRVEAAQVRPGSIQIAALRRPGGLARGRPRRHAESGDGGSAASPTRGPQRTAVLRRRLRRHGRPPSADQQGSICLSSLLRGQRRGARAAQSQRLQSLPSRQDACPEHQADRKSTQNERAADDRAVRVAACDGPRQQPRQSRVHGRRSAQAARDRAQEASQRLLRLRYPGIRYPESTSSASPNN